MPQWMERLLIYFTGKKLLGLLVRCKDEYIVEEFCRYYLSQGVDDIYIIDDDSNDKSIYSNIENNPQVTIIFSQDIISRNVAATQYQCLKNNYKWIIYVDIDEFITTRKSPNKTIREELQSTFKGADCIKVPWVMMASNGQERSPKSILQSNFYRWNHDLRHEHEVHKFRCRYDQIEVKCIFKTSAFDSITDHHPVNPKKTHPAVVDGVYGCESGLDPWHHGLREADINQGIFLCYHFRIISRENSLNKLQTNQWYIEDGYTIEDLMSSDYSEVIDRTLAEKL